MHNPDICRELLSDDVGQSGLSIVCFNFEFIIKSIFSRILNSKLLQKRNKHVGKCVVDGYHMKQMEDYLISDNRFGDTFYCHKAMKFDIVRKFQDSTHIARVLTTVLSRPEC